MICLGNICRSPLAEGILSSKLNSNSIFVDSAGTGAYHIGNQPDERSIAVANNYGIDISKQRARKFQVSDFDIFDSIYVMDENNFQDILSLARNHQDKQKVKMILNEIHPNKNKSVPDPYYGGEEGFENVFRMLDEACEIISKKIQK
ncbi:MAG: low molecular weight phosphotyrosine protein phosphatase [Flavobacteriia bacterium]|nr:low molecular weight phosphotyrosine protein phosphatase [Flavobacteriia bacterium]PIV96119.1 MAG: protein-tyrosine-phosphatase [Flavobacteriaceae bacterium CG17_big_fil_post_rev_8_21_14_2_50_31_13]PIX13045.1 MAG: protein-tyrosine-phosphatase [Flavobacteriaceae bacterium CG_4_8_14_3_um_filter_31_8]PIY14336.1 MAG: protein-tyrosine-phosphatase [Flavobacteriaceae bacterium CG_4_10_14_3_um_filter_31_253]PIZ10423.1 MAG: protein-tyrosine-phosphatase [Flavobacteriaceae bacterium CG_4_10_14_0_8_um_f